MVYVLLQRLPNSAKQLRKPNLDAKMMQSNFAVSCMWQQRLLRSTNLLRELDPNAKHLMTKMIQTFKFHVYAAAMVA
jgi:hypothetical protein